MIEEDLLADLDYLENCLDEARNAILKVIVLANAKLDAAEVERLRTKKKQIHEDLKDSVDREWVGLTYRDSMRIIEQCESNIYILNGANKFELLELIEMIEAKLKEKNT